MKRTCRGLCGILSGKEQPCIMEACRGPWLLPHRRPPNNLQRQHLSVDQILHWMLASWTWTVRISTSHSHPKIESNFTLKISGHLRVLLSHSSLRKTEATPVDLLGMYAMSASLVAPIKVVGNVCEERCGTQGATFWELTFISLQSLTHPSTLTVSPKNASEFTFSNQQRNWEINFYEHCL